MRIPTALVSWKPCWRIIPSRYPTIHPFERVAVPEDWEALFEVEALTNDRLRHEKGLISPVPEKDRPSGAGASYILAAFTHLNPEGSRFSDGTWGVFYAARELGTAVAETRYHRARFMLATREETMSLEMRVLAVDLKGRLHDLRRYSSKGVLSPESYEASQAMARGLKSLDSPGVVYPSVRARRGQCAAVFKASCLSRGREKTHLIYEWDGRTIAHVYEKVAWD